MSEKQKHFDVIIIGGSYAGLSAAMALGRSRRKVLIIDAGKPCNRQTPHSHNFITHDGEQPAHIAAKAKEQVLRYPTVTIHEGMATMAVKRENDFEISTDHGSTFHARKVLLATGISDQMPNITGFAECWGISALHCPYCHGYEIADKHFGVLAHGENAFEMSRLLAHWANQLTVFTNGAHGLSPVQLTKLQAHNITLIETEVKEVQHENGYLHHLALADGTTYAIDALFARLPYLQHSDSAKQLGCTLNEAGLIAVNDFQLTSVEGVYAAGDNCSMRALSVAIASGTKAGAFINKAMIDEEF